MEWRNRSAPMTSRIFLAFFILLLCTSCSFTDDKEIKSVGLLVEGTIHDQTWGNKGYNGLLLIRDELGVDIYFKEGVNSQLAVNAAVEEFAKQNVNLIFGHSSTYGQYFAKLHDKYPNIQFVYFNGNKVGENLTSVNFNSHAMGFFAGMVASSMTETGKVGVISAFEWQPEVDGFYEGAKYVNPMTQVELRYVNNWDNQEKALDFYEELNELGVDVYYPTGDNFHLPVIERIKENNQYAIGYISDQIELGESTILTSTEQHVDKLYLNVALLIREGLLTSHKLEFDFQDGAISLGTFSDEVPANIQENIKNAVKEYIETGKLPNEK
jgi:transcriptional activator of comK gene